MQVNEKLIQSLITELKISEDEAIKLSKLEIDFNYLFSGTFVKDTQKLAVPYINDLTNVLNNMNTEINKVDN